MRWTNWSVRDSVEGSVLTKTGSKTMPLTAETFAALVIEDSQGRWEIDRQKVREKPPMSFGHNQTARNLARQLILQLSPDLFDVLQNSGHALLPNGDSYIPDIVVVPNALTSPFQMNPKLFEAYEHPLPFVAEIWSPSTENEDIDATIPGYRLRGDLEIWRFYPFDRTASIWRRKVGGEYQESEVRTGSIELFAIPGITIDVGQLFGDPIRN